MCVCVCVFSFFLGGGGGGGEGRGKYKQIPPRKELLLRASNRQVSWADEVLKWSRGHCPAIERERERERELNPTPYKPDKTFQPYRPIDPRNLKPQEQKEQKTMAVL